MNLTKEERLSLKGCRALMVKNKADKEKELIIKLLKNLIVNLLNYKNLSSDRVVLMLSTESGLSVKRTYEIIDKLIEDKILEYDYSDKLAYVDARCKLKLIESK